MLNIVKDWLRYGASILSHTSCIQQKGGMLPGAQGKWGQPRWGGWGRARPPRREQDKKLTASSGGKNSTMEWEEDGKKGHAWQRGPIVHRVRIINVRNILVNAHCHTCRYHRCFKTLCTVISLSYLLFCFKRTNHMAKNHLHSSSDVCHRHVWHTS